MGDSHLELWVRIWVAGESVVDEPLRAGPEIVLSHARHQAIIDAARAADKVWLLEVSDPDDAFYPIRFGTDPTVMVEPVAFSVGAMVDALTERARQMGLP